MLKDKKVKSESEVRAFHIARKARMDESFKKWSETDIGKKLDRLYTINPTAARNTAFSLDYQEAHLMTMNEDMILQQYGLRPENVLTVVRLGVANANRGNIFMEYPLQTYDDAIWFVDKTYAQTIAGQGGANQGDKIYESASRYQAGAAKFQLIGTGTGGQVAFTATLTNAPLVRNGIKIVVSDVYAGSDDGNGGFVGSNIDGGATNTVDYETGDITVTFATAPAAGAAVAIEYHWDAERSSLFGNYPKIRLDLRKQRFDAKLMPLGYEYSMMVEDMLGKAGLADASSMLVGAVAEEHAKAKDYRAVELARRMALANGVYTFDADITAAGEVSNQEHAQSILPAIGDIGGAIFNDIKRGDVNKIIAGSKATNYMKRHNLWEDDTSQPRSGLYLAGRLSDKEVYTCPADEGMMAEDEAILTYKNAQEGMDLSIVFGVVTELAASLKYPQFYVDGNVGVVEDDMVINDKFIRYLKIDNIPSVTTNP